MASMTVTNEELRVALTTREKVAGVPAVRVALTGLPHDELIVSTEQAEAVPGAVRAHAGVADRGA